MHGNPHAHFESGTDLNGGSMNAGAALWLGLPAAREYFDPSALSVADHSRMAARGARRRADYEVSRALLAFADIGRAAHSLSHSAEHAALLVAPGGCRIGVDLEMNRPRDFLRLARFAFDAREVVALEAAPEAARPRLFYTLWTLKESVAKALQLELVDALRQCVFWEDDGEWRGRIPTPSAWGAAVFQPRPQLFLAATWAGGLGFAGLRQWEWPPRQSADWPVVARLGSAVGIEAAQP